MSKRRLRDTKEPKSKLDRVSRDLNRTYLHGTRAQTNDGSFKPAAVVTGQQIPADVPTTGSMTFKFSTGKATGVVSVDHATATSSETMMAAALAKPDKYLKLNLDDKVPTWIFHQRDFTLPKQPVPEDVLKLIELQKVLLHVPQAVVQEVQRLGKACDVSLWHCDESTQEVSALPPTWQTAILLRFPLKAQETDATVFEVKGTPQGDRYYLDQLGLLPSANAVAPPAIDSVIFLLEGTPNTAPEPVKTWTLVRTNLTEEARHGQIRALRAAEVKLPFVATERDPEDSLRLLQMASITNSGGYFLRAQTNKTVTTLVVCVLLKPESHKSGSVSVPTAANSFVYADKPPNPNVARFEGMESVQIAPFVPPGFVAFGWTRQEPSEKQGDEEKFGYGTISLVEYHATDATGKVWEDGNSMTAISPLQALPGDHIASALDQRTDSRRRATSVAMRLLAPHDLQARAALIVDLRNDQDDIRYYRGILRIYYPDRGESPYAPLGDTARRTVTITPGFRDVFGNRFPTSGAMIQRKIFYTDAIIAPAEWPGFRFSLFPSSASGKPSLSLEVTYQPLPAGRDKVSRRSRLGEIGNQLKGVSGDVKLVLHASPLLQSPVLLAQQITAWIYGKVIPAEQMNRNRTEQEEPPPLFLPLGPFICDGSPFHDPRQFQPEVEIMRTDQNLLPQPTDLPDDSQLRKIIQEQISSATSQVNLACKASGSRVFDDAKRGDEFKLVAEAFQQQLSSTYSIRVGFLRDQFNQHELWLVPNDLFPSPPSDATGQSIWSFATARPLKNTLWTDDFVVPDFASKTSDVPNWKGYPLRAQHFVEQDFDELARSAFALIEAEAFKPGIVSDPNNADLTRAALEAKERIARRLALFKGTDNPTYLTSVFATRSRPSTRRQQVE